MDLKKLSYEKQVMFALYCARQTIHLTDLPEAHKCIEVIEAYLLGKASKEECKAARAAAAAYAAAGAAVHAADAAAHAAARTTIDVDIEEKIKQEQMEYYLDLLYLDENTENILLETKGKD